MELTQQDGGLAVSWARGVEVDSSKRGSIEMVETVVAKTFQLWGTPLGILNPTP